MASSTRVYCWLLLAAALAMACVALAESSAGAEAEAPAPASSVFGCNPITDKACKPQVVPKVLPGGGADIDGDGDEDELPGFDPHLTILGHAH
ncbi:hypothetical protein HU200_033467 [Digitaria exilis]|uniref:Uncharacterized protein n=1 Tax=Digitaria exilis TaxID=1010633 RepID=A0A835BLD8_9POAL|nr:hypothetical protein HU200_033467 [Digitaria exilis]